MAFRDATALAPPSFGVQNTHVAPARAASTAKGQSRSWQADFHMEEDVTGGVGTGAKPSAPSTAGRMLSLLGFWIVLKASVQMCVLMCECVLWTCTKWRRPACKSALIKSTREVFFKSV